MLSGGKIVDILADANNTASKVRILLTRRTIRGTRSDHVGTRLDVVQVHISIGVAANDTDGSSTWGRLRGREERMLAFSLVESFGGN